MSVLSLGAMTFGSGMPPVTTVDERDAGAMIDHALEAGVNLIDTADVYAFGQSEEILGRCVRALHGRRRDDVLVATKCGFGSHDAGALSYDNVVADCEASLRRLGLDHIDLYQLHRPDRATPIEETLRALDDLVDARARARHRHQQLPRVGDVGRGGASARARPARVHRDAALLLAGGARSRARAHPGVSGRRPGRDRVEPAVEWLPHRSVPRGEGATPGEGRRTTFTFPPVDPELGERALVALAAVADGRGVSMAQVALAWVLAQPGITSAIVGASSLQQLDDNLAAADLELTSEELATLDAATALAPIYPAWWDPAMGIPGPTDLLEPDLLGTDHLKEPQ